MRYLKLGALSPILASSSSECLWPPSLAMASREALICWYINVVDETVITPMTRNPIAVASSVKPLLLDIDSTQ